MSAAHAISIYLIAAATIGCVLARPRDLPEAVWAMGGAALLLACGLLSPAEAWEALGKAWDVCLFLAGMMLLSELARREGVFDWCAAVAVNRARHSPARLYWLIYGVGVVVTVFLSNDATAVVMTPAVLAATRAARVRNPLPYLLACALVANAASFVLPISNPANLVLFGGRLPRLWEWLRMFALPAMVSIVITGWVLYLWSRNSLEGEVREPEEKPRLTGSGRLALWGIAIAAAALLAASAFGWPLGAPALAVAVVAVSLAAARDARALREIPARVSWSVLPMVAGLFMVVEAVDKAGALELCGAALAALGRMPAWQGSLAGAFGVTALSNLINNLPSGLMAGAAMVRATAAPPLRDALLIGVDLGPNLSVTGSLATVLWLIALRRDGVRVSGWSFLKVGAVVMPAALLAAALASAAIHGAL
ncbi:MAG TPA: arsenic transporter [Chthoniobacteraceae bacterium]|nr:arsenic transporter [Chthoniobacteraceae bacterium]